uniref:DUF945 family protein n=1 Tax=Desulfobacca acetoxidans TaxID=60893 RepID=A0A7V4G9Z9_9BACT
MASQRKLGVIIPLIIVGVLVLLAGGGYLGYKFFAAGKVEQEVKQAVADLEKANPGLSIKYDNLAMSWQTGRVNLKNLKVTHKDDPVSLTAETASVRDLTAVGITRIPSSLIMDRVVVTTRKGKVTIDQVEASAAVNRIVTRQEMAADPLLGLEVVRQADIVLKNLAVADKEDSVTVGSLSLAYGAEKEQMVKIALNRLAVVSQGKEAGTKVEMDDLKFQVGLNRVLRREELAADPAVLLGALQQFDFSVKNISVKDKQGIFSLGGGSLTWEGAKERKVAFTLSALDLNLPEVKLTLESYANHLTLDPQNILIYSDILLKNFLLALPPAQRGSDPFGFLREMGYTSLKFNLDGKGTYNPQTQEDVSTMQLSGEKMGTIKVDLAGAGYRRPPLPLQGGLMGLLDFAQQWEKAMDEFALRSLKISYQDQGLVKQLLEMGGKAMGKNAKAFSQDLVNNINGTLLLFPLPQNLRDQMKAVNQFITNPNEIQISLAFKKPLRLKALKDPSPDQVLNLLGQADFNITAR